MALLQSDNNERESLYPIVYGSKTLTPAKMRYANIERKLLGVVGALEKFLLFYIRTPCDSTYRPQTFESNCKESSDKCTSETPKAAVEIK